MFVILVYDIYIYILMCLIRPMLLWFRSYTGRFGRLERIVSAVAI